MTAAIGLAEFGAAMGAAILEGMDAAVLIPRNDDRNAADIRADIITRPRQFRFKRDIVPGRTQKDPLVLALVNPLVGVDPVRDFRRIVRPLQVNNRGLGMSCGAIFEATGIVHNAGTCGGAEFCVPPPWPSMETSI